MPPRSPTQAFDPTPALEHDPDNFSPLNGEARMAFFQGNDAKSVHFSDTPVPIVARHSIATTNVPLLPQVSSASHVPKQAFQTSTIDMTAYIESCRSLNEQLRQAHETERKGWNIERSALQARIADLEFRLNKSRDSKRRSSNDSSATSAHSFRADFRSMYNTSQPSGAKTLNLSSEPQNPSASPIWRGPETTPPVTRVFSHDDSDVNHLPSISEDAEPFPDLSKEISPTTKEEARPVDVSQVDRSLDGITLKSTGPAVTSSFVTKITSPQFGSPPHSPPPRPQNRPPSNTLVAGLNQLDVSNLLDPLDKKLKLHAGHTPMALDGALSVSENVTEVPTPKEDHPPEPAPTKRPPLRPSEDSDSYFSFTGDAPPVQESEGDAEGAAAEEPEEDSNFEPKDDPPLKGPLMLDPSARSKAASDFLEKVDAKLMEAAASSRLRSDTTTTDNSEPPPREEAPHSNGDGHGHVKNKDSMDEMPKLRIKKSTNFGSAWGGGEPGRI